MALTKILYGLSTISFSLLISILVVKIFTVVLSIFSGTFRFRNLLYVAIIISILFIAYLVGDKIY